MFDPVDDRLTYLFLRDIIFEQLPKVLETNQSSNIFKRILKKPRRSNAIASIRLVQPLVTARFLTRDLLRLLPRLLRALLRPFHHEDDIVEGGVLPQAGESLSVQSPHHSASVIIITHGNFFDTN